MMPKLALASVRKAYRAVIDERITFRSFEDSPQRTLKESIRRSYAFNGPLYNADLALSQLERMQEAIFNAFFYIIFPWIAVMFTINSVMAFTIDPVIGNN